MSRASAGCFNPHSRETPSGTWSFFDFGEKLSVSILTRGKPRVERYFSATPSIWAACFNPHSRETPSGTQAHPRPGRRLARFNPHSRETPSGTPPTWPRSSSRPCFNPHSRETPSGTRGFSAPRKRRSFNPHSRETPSGTPNFRANPALVRVSILTRGKPRVEPGHSFGSNGYLPVFQSSLEGNPEWNRLRGRGVLGAHPGFNPHSRETPSGTQAGGGAPRPGGFNPHSRETPSGTAGGDGARAGGRGFNPHSRETPSGTDGLRGQHPARGRFNPHSRETPSGTLEALADEIRELVSILTRGKPRVEQRQKARLGIFRFQSSLEGNPEWNGCSRRPRAPRTRFNPHSRETPSGTPPPGRRPSSPRVSILTRGKPRVEP